MKRWLVGGVILALGLVVGAGLIIASVAVNRYTSTDKFCSSCHTMASLAADPHYLQSPHHANAAGVQASCGDCHIPRTSWFAETYAHAVDGITDLVAEATHDYGDQAVWAARRAVLAGQVREEMRRQGSVTCLSCHNPATIEPSSEAGRAAHALLRQDRVTCIDCHINLVHAPVPPSLGFIRGSGLGAPAK